MHFNSFMMMSTPCYPEVLNYLGFLFIAANGAVAKQECTEKDESRRFLSLSLIFFHVRLIFLVAL